MVSEFSLKMTEKAATDLDDILSYIAYSLSNPQAASHFYDKLNKTLDSVILFPEMGSPVDNPIIELDGVRKVLVGNYTVFYYPDYSIKTITVLRIIYSCRNLDEIIRTLNKQ